MSFTLYSHVEHYLIDGIGCKYLNKDKICPIAITWIEIPNLYCKSFVKEILFFYYSAE